VLVLKEIASHLSRIGIDLLNRDFVRLTCKLCLEQTATIYNNEIAPLEVSPDAAAHIFADILFFRIALPGNDEVLKEVGDKFLAKVWFRLAMISDCPVS